MKSLIKVMFQAGLIGSVIVWSGCAVRSANVKSSVVDYLYPDQEAAQAAKTPKLTFPMKMGIAFVPESGATSSNIPGGQIIPKNFLTEQQRIDLMETIGEHMKKHSIIGHVVIIPSSNLKSKGGFVNLNQIRALYGIDQILLLSYDQSQFTDEGAATATYWTGIGAYLVAGEKNRTHTILEANVFDIESQKMLFRSVGSGTVDSSATLVNLSEQTRADSAEGFKKASEDLILNLDKEIVTFKNTLQ